jgi:hypothetical protein
MTSVPQIALTDQELDNMAWDFLGSKFAGKIYANWSIDQRVHAYLVYCGMANIVNDGSVSSALRERVMANFGRALGMGILPSGRTGSVRSCLGSRCLRATPHLR